MVLLLLRLFYKVVAEAQNGKLSKITAASKEGTEPLACDILLFSSSWTRKYVSLGQILTLESLGFLFTLPLTLSVLKVF